MYLTSRLFSPFYLTAACCDYDTGVPLYRSVQCPVHKKEHDWHKHGDDLKCPECGQRMVSTIGVMEAEGRRTPKTSSDDLIQYQRKKTPRVGYHTTDIENLLSIAQTGLVPSPPYLDSPDSVYFSDALYPKKDPYAMETLHKGIVTLVAKLPSGIKAYDDVETREFTGTQGGPDDNIGTGTAFFILKGVSPKDLSVVVPGTRKQVPIEKFVKGKQN